MNPIIHTLMLNMILAFMFLQYRKSSLNYITGTWAAVALCVLLIEDLFIFLSHVLSRNGPNLVYDALRLSALIIFIFFLILPYARTLVNKGKSERGIKAVERPPMPDQDNPELAPSTNQRFIGSDKFQSLQALFSKWNSFHLTGAASNWIAFVIFYFFIFLVGSSVIIAILKTFTSIPFYFLDPLWIGCILTWLIGLVLIVSKKARTITDSYKIGVLVNRFLIAPIYWGILSSISPLKVKLQRSVFLVFSIITVFLFAHWFSLPSATVKRAGEQLIRTSLNRDACTWILNNLRMLSSMKIAGVDKEEQREWVIANGRNLDLIRRDGRPFHVSPNHITFFHIQVNNNNLPQQFQRGETETQCMSLK
jgi:hypothetical protein